jgi:predicted ABC-type ATPase
MRELIILGGANGSGKTTLALELMEETHYSFLNADEIEKTLNESGLGASSIQAGKLFFEKLNELFAQEKSFIMESTLSGNYLKKIIQKARLQGYKISMVYVFLKNPETCIERIKIRVQKGGHFIPDEIVRRRFYRSLEHFWNTFKNLADEWVMYYNSNEVIEGVATGSKTEFLILNETFFQIFKSNLENGSPTIE